MEANLETVRKEILSNNLDYLAKQYDLHRTYCIEYLTNRKMCQSQTAEDVFSDAILVLRNKIIHKQLDNLSGIRNYLLTTCINKVKDHKKKVVRHGSYEHKVRKLFYDNPSEEQMTELLDLSLEDICRNALRRLGDRCQEILKLFYYERMSLKDIAELMNFSSAESVKSTKSVCFKKWVTEAKLLKEKSF